MVITIINVLLAAISLALILPLFPVIGLLIKINSRGPVLFICNETGRDGKVYKSYRFRTMSIGPDRSLNIPNSKSTSLVGAWSIDITPVGRILHRTGLKDLPQFLNVLKGDITIRELVHISPELLGFHLPFDTMAYGVIRALCLLMPTAGAEHAVYVIENRPELIRDCGRIRAEAFTFYYLARWLFKEALYLAVHPIRLINRELFRP
jgi:hypothetical protein